MAVKKVSAVIAPTPGTVTMRRHVSLPRARRTSWSSSALLRSPATRHAANSAAMAGESGVCGAAGEYLGFKGCPLAGGEHHAEGFQEAADLVVEAGTHRHELVAC